MEQNHPCLAISRGAASGTLGPGREFIENIADLQLDWGKIDENKTNTVEKKKHKKNTNRPKTQKKKHAKRTKPIKAL